MHVQWNVRVGGEHRLDVVDPRVELGQQLGELSANLRVRAQSRPRFVQRVACGIGEHRGQEHAQQPSTPLVECVDVDGRRVGGERAIAIDAFVVVDVEKAADGSAGALSRSRRRAKSASWQRDAARTSFDCWRRCRPVRAHSDRGMSGDSRRPVDRNSATRSCQRVGIAFLMLARTTSRATGSSSKWQPAGRKGKFRSICCSRSLRLPPSSAL